MLRYVQALSAIDNALAVTGTLKQWRSDQYWTNENFQSFENCFKICFTLLRAALFLMDSGEPKLKELSEERFGSIIFFLRLGGIPFKTRKLSTIYAIYMTTAIICSFTVFLGFFADLYVHLDDLGYAMTNMRLLISMTDVLWLLTCCRYVRTVAITVIVSRFE
jgi:hypothetical protein